MENEYKQAKQMNNTKQARMVMMRIRHASALRAQPAKSRDGERHKAQVGVLQKLGVFRCFLTLLGGQRSPR